MSNHQKVKFIRVRGRIVPITAKNKQQRNRNRSNLNKADFAVGAGAGATTIAFFKNKKLKKRMGKFSIGAGLVTMALRSNNELKLGDFAEQSIAGLISKNVGAAVGIGAGLLALKGLGKVAKFAKLRKATKAARSATSFKQNKNAVKGLKRLTI